eukprot:m.257803 g.257803  ORF g.257803 m.257803 type:complete len:498 (-) comp19184_c5_seq7:111-1604(-)
MMSARRAAIEADPAIKLFDHITSVASSATSSAAPSQPGSFKLTDETPGTPGTPPPAATSSPQLQGRTHKRSLSEDDASVSSSPPRADLGSPIRVLSPIGSGSPVSHGSPVAARNTVLPPPPTPKEAKETVTITLKRASSGLLDLDLADSAAGAFSTPLALSPQSSASSLTRSPRCSTDVASPKQASLVSFTLRRSGKQPIGLQIAGGTTQRPGLFVKQVIPDSAAARDGRIRRGDRLIEVNTHDVFDVPHQEVVDILKATVGDVKLTLARRPKKRKSRQGFGSSASLALSSRQSSGLMIDSPQSSAASSAAGSSTSLMDEPSSGVSNLDPLWNKRKPSAQMAITAEESDQSANDPPAASSSPSTPHSTTASASTSLSASPSKQRAVLRKEGWLLKRGGGWQNNETSLFHRKNWKRRFFKLQDTMLKYYRHEAVQGETAVGYVNIDADTEITRSDPKSFLVVSSRRNLHLVAKTEFEATQWIEQLRLAVQVALDASMV